MVQPVYIGFIEVPPTIERKLRERRGLTGREVRDAFEWPSRPAKAYWHYNPDHGRRVIAIASSTKGTLKAILQPVDPVQGTWRLRTCVIAGRGDRA
jgi:hypothetical protein